MKFVKQSFDTDATLSATIKGDNGEHCGLVELRLENNMLKIMYIVNGYPIFERWPFIVNGDSPNFQPTKQ